MRPSIAVVRQSWWWLFGLFIALPAISLALLGLSAIRADEIERQQRVRDEQDRILRLADAALTAGLDRETTRGDALRFEVDSRTVVSFSADRVYTGPFGVEPASLASMALPPDAAALVEQAQAAATQGRTDEALSTYKRLTSFPAARAWADLQTLVLRSDTGAATLVQAARPDLAASDARSPSGIPLAIVVSSFYENVPLPERQRFTALLTKTLDSLRAGRWWLSLDQRRLYDSELRRWLADIDPATAIEKDDRLQDITNASALVLTAFDTSRQQPSRAQMVGVDAGRILLVWTRPSQSSDAWSGVAVPHARATALFTEALEPLLGDAPVQAVLRDRDWSLWGTPGGPDAARGTPLSTVPEWTLAFADAVPPSSPRATRLLNYVRIVTPIVVLACGLVMTAWIVRRELALAELQSTFIAAVTHEFKSPITSIRLLMERISGGRISPGDSPQRYYAAIDREADRLESLVNRLLDAQKLQTGQKTYAFHPAALDAVVRDAVDRMRPQAEARHIELGLRTSSEIPPLALDKESVSDAVRNLLDNAIKYSPERTHVDVSLGMTNGHVELTIGDEGIGVDPADAQKIFEPFFRSRRGDHANVHGTGLGLTLVKATVEAHGGSVRVASDGKRGSAFTLTFPVNNGSRDQHEAAR